jgi:hypothetical protein
MSDPTDPSDSDTLQGFFVQETERVLVCCDELTTLAQENA